MAAFHRRAKLLCALLLVLLPFGTGSAKGQPPFYRIGAPSPPVRDPRLTTDNGIPGTGSYYYRDYPYPSLRQALQEYGWFGHRFDQSHSAAATGAVEVSQAPALIWVHLPSDAELRVGGQMTSQRGDWRRFVTPNLPAGIFEYEVAAHWNENGQEMHRIRSVRIRSASEVVIDLLADEEASSPLPLPRRVPSP